MLCCNIFQKNYYLLNLKENMGGHSSSERTVDALLSFIAHTIVSSQSTCLAAAENSILYEIGTANNFMLKNVTLSQVSDASVQCTHNANIAVGDAFSPAFLQAQLENVLGTANGIGTDNVNVASTIAMAITTTMVNSCMLTATNEYRVTVRACQGTTSLLNIDLSQIATAQMKLCLSSDTIVVNGGVPLTTYLAEQAPRFPGLKTLVPPDCTVMYGVTGGMVGLILLVISLTAWRYKTIQVRTTRVNY